MDIIQIGLWLMVGACLVMGLVLLVRGDIGDFSRIERGATIILNLGRAAFLVGAFIFMVTLPVPATGLWLYVACPASLFMLTCFGALGTIIAMFFWVAVLLGISLLAKIADLFVKYPTVHKVRVDRKRRHRNG